MKSCTKCGVQKTLDSFQSNKGYAGGRHTWCKQCQYAAIKAWRRRNPEWMENYYEKWDAENVESKRAYRRKWARENWQNRSLEQKLHDAIRSKVWRQLRTGKGGKRTFWLLGYSVDELRLHLEMQFADGMSWDNWGEWEIDHKRPCSSFTIASSEDSALRECWALSNLQPLWAKR